MNRAFLPVVVLAASSLACGQSWFERLEFPGGSNFVPKDISDDASVIFGNFNPSGHTFKGAIWRRGLAMQTFTSSQLYSGSFNGQYAAVGTGRWSVIDAQMTNWTSWIGHSILQACTVSNTGNLIGFARPSGTIYDCHAFSATFTHPRWVYNQIAAPVDGWNDMEASAPGDGARMFGNIINTNRYGLRSILAVFWRSHTEHTNLFRWEKGEHWNDPIGGILGVSNDGVWAVGRSGYNYGGIVSNAVRFSEGTGLETIFEGSACDVSTDGRTVVGLDLDRRPVIWIEEFGVFPLAKAASASNVTNLPSTSNHIPRLAGDGVTILWGSGFFHWDRRLALDPTVAVVSTGTHISGALSALSEAEGTSLTFVNNGTSQKGELTVQGQFDIDGVRDVGAQVVSKVNRGGIFGSLWFRDRNTGRDVFARGWVAGPNWTTVQGRFSRDPSSLFAGGEPSEARIRFEPINDEDPTGDVWIHEVDQVNWLVQFD